MEKNSGITVLKIVMSFAVVCRHFWLNYQFASLYTHIYPVTLWAVPVFMIMSFMLSYKHFAQGDRKWFFERIWKLYKPILIWGVIYSSIYTMMGLLTGKTWVTGKDFLIHLCTGASPSICGPMWFELDLVVLTVIVFVIISLLGDSRGYILMCILACMALLSEYTGGLSLLVDGLSWSVQHSWGILPEMFPFVVVGYSFSKFSIISKIKRNKKKVAFWCGFGLFMTVACKDRFPVAYGVWYQGVYLILVASCVVILFCLVPESFWDRGRLAIDFLGNYTMGVYFMHPLVAFFINLIAGKIGFGVSTLGICLIVYFLSICLSSLIDRLPFRFCKGLV